MRNRHQIIVKGALEYALRVLIDNARDIVILFSRSEIDDADTSERKGSGHHMSSPNPEQFQLMLMWQMRAIRASLAHYVQHQQYKRLRSVLTIFNLCAGISVLFLANNKLIEVDSGIYGKIMISIASFLVVLSTSLQFVMNFEDKIHLHKAAGNEFTNIKRNIELLLISDTVTQQNIENIKAQYDHASASYPIVRKQTWAAVEQRVEKEIRDNKSFCDRVKAKLDPSEPV